MLWWKSGVIPPLGTYKSYWLDPFSLFWIEVILVQFAELKRYGRALLPHVGIMPPAHFPDAARSAWGTPSPAAALSFMLAVMQQVAGLPPPWISG